MSNANSPYLGDTGC